MNEAKRGGVQEEINDVHKKAWSDIDVCPDRNSESESEFIYYILL
jgi:chemotaxis signal transduction protein